ncbi:hypothetical protein A3J19_04055 [Candidatus Daviesbacteria bacterium RIFCSPLOWO2_02_FULL_41_8]|uniref:SH3b domain-containing protein n=2 Tax=Candidatus Daviesiibacteriota TaxID=1752718 RepID=A0A1F5NL23_9BACT|nr:MAG: hypothetical protein A2871_03925 [Candidatus Daviesbacteria bacterium RIFCSPHIGHO2_01_FULL_41_23]OGE62310.1 MAG: hypothetical protein A2967_02545 [Candidatus Daviesbacteria bacterium RIFCSPLOWO2_01_FULL_41_32]OGE78406.1 MAG: hypothetical protein A3J19_04055 [Candidatus Daviesbacteria bacterium RIFCSPLOWO2_02_FULL_41_8]
MKKIIAWFLIIISLSALLLRFSDKITEVVLGVKKTSGISVLSEPSDATVYLNEKQVGQTPWGEKGLDIGDYLVKIEKGKASWQGRVKLTGGTVTVVTRDIATDSASAAGEVLTLDKGKGLTVISNPPDALVEIDGQPYGKTPVAVNINSGEHAILISHQNYLPRSFSADLPENFNLTVSVDLASTEADLAAASSPSSSPSPVITQTPAVLVKQTPTGFLRVRDKPSLNGKEIAQVKPGESFPLLAELKSWDKIRLSDGREGYVSSAYVEKKSL